MFPMYTAPEGGMLLPLADTEGGVWPASQLGVRAHLEGHKLPLTPL